MRRFTPKPSVGTAQVMATRKGRYLPNKDRIPLDGGWAWFIVVGCFLMHFFVAGLSRSYGVIFIQLRQRFQSSAGVTAWIGGVCSAIRMGFSPLSTCLTNRFGTRIVVICGGLIISIGMFISAFTPNTEFMFFSYAILTGLGGTLSYAPSLVLTGQYFKKYRSIAVGIGSAGSGVGVFTLPLLIEKLFEYYGYFGAMVILSGVMLNVCICGALYRPLEANIVPKKSPPPCEMNELTKDYEDPKISDRELLTENHNQNPVEVQDEKPDHMEDEKLPKSNKLSKYIDLTICRSKTFVVFTLSLGFFTMSYMGAQMLLPALGESNGHSRTNSVFLLSILGLSDMAGRILSGFLFDSPFFRNHRTACYNLAIFVAGSCHFAWGLMSTYPLLAAASAIHGLFNGCVVSQRAVILSDLLGVENLNTSFGLTVFVQGCGLMIGPALAGVLRDVTGNYTYSYLFTGGMSLVGGILFFLCTQSHRFCKKQTEERGERMSDTETA